MLYTYDEMTFNEWQKNDPQFSSMLDSVRRGCPTKETVGVLKQRVIQMSLSETFLSVGDTVLSTPVSFLFLLETCRIS